MQIWQDKELGRLVIRVDARAKRFIFRAKNDAVYVTVPYGATEKEIKAVIERLREKLLSSKKSAARALIDLDYNIDKPYFKLSLVSGTQDRFLAHSELGKMQIVCPPSADFSDEKLQRWLHKVIEEALRKNAQVVLTPWIKELSTRYQLPFRTVKINSSKGRWGSCSGSKNINLSYYLMLLPKHLIEYVLLHELSHTREMNHGEKFWALLNSLTDNKARVLREELKKHKTEI